MQTIDEILNKIKAIKGIKKDIELAKLLSVKQNTLATWRIRKTIPYDVIYRFCEEHQIDVVWLLTGQITTKYIEVDGKRVLVMAGEPGLYKKEEEKPLIAAEETVIYETREDKELAEIIDILKHDLPEVKTAVLKILKYRKGSKEAIQELLKINQPLKEEG